MSRRPNILSPRDNPSADVQRAIETRETTFSGEPFASALSEIQATLLARVQTFNNIISSLNQPTSRELAAQEQGIMEGPDLFSGGFGGHRRRGARQSLADTINDSLQPVDRRIRRHRRRGYSEYILDPEEEPEDLVQLRRAFHAASAQKLLLKDRLQREVYNRLRRNLLVPCGLELWLTWYLCGADERESCAKYFLDNFSDFWTPLESYIPDFDQLKPAELSYEPYAGVEHAHLIDPFTRRTSPWFSVRVVESQLRSNRLERQRMRDALMRRPRYAVIVDDSSESGDDAQLEPRTIPSSHSILHDPDTLDDEADEADEDDEDPW